MPYNIDATWRQPIELKYVDSKGLIYECTEIETLPKSEGVYVFGRQHGEAVAPLYIGRTTNIQRRLEQHLRAVPLMMGIRDSPRGSRFFMYCEVNFKRGQKRDPVLQTLETALIAHALSEGHELLNEQGTKRPNHTFSFNGNRTSEAVAPRFMRTRAW